MSYGFNPGFPRLFLCTGQIVHALLTRPPLSILLYFVRLACVRHAASVRPEPGSNSRLIFLLKITHSIIFVFHYFFCSFYIELRSFVHQFICSLRRINRELIAVDLPSILYSGTFLMPQKTYFMVEVCPHTYVVDKIGLGHTQRFLMLFYCLSSIFAVSWDSFSSLSYLCDTCQLPIFSFVLGLCRLRQLC